MEIQYKKKNMKKIGDKKHFGVLDQFTYYYL